MISTSAVPPNGNVYSNAATKSRQNLVGAVSISNTGARSEVNISAAAQELAKNDQGAQPRFKLADFVTGWFNKDFPQDVMDEAKARLADIKANGRVGADGPMMLPLLPENQKLLDSFQQEMKTIRDAGWANATPAQSERVNLLMNLSMRLRLVGWEKPMTEADVQRKLDVSFAMAKLSPNDPVPEPDGDSDNAAGKMIAEMESKAVPSVWRQRWQKEGLTMPKDVVSSRDRSILLDVAEAAGIGEDEFLAKLRELAGNLKGNSLTHAIESFISERYVAMTASQEAEAVA
ncbi:MAG: hypothetical protein LLG15_03780 [Betaproteobacteria bacterium]|nr:hypothetical protein [Betaproteobacteria bacterium]